MQFTDEEFSKGKLWEVEQFFGSHPSDKISEKCGHKNALLSTWAWPISFGLASVQLSSVAQSYPTLWDPMNCSTPGLPVYHQLLESTQTHIHQVGDAIQPSHPLLSPSLPALNPSQHQGFFLWVNSSHEVAKVLEFQLQHQPFQWIFRVDFL